MMVTSSERQALLKELSHWKSESSTEQQSDDLFRRAFYPVAEHLRIFEPTIHLIIGYHGSGKSTLFKAATEQLLSADSIRSIMGRDLFLQVLSQYQTSWLVGYAAKFEFADSGTLRIFVQSLPSEEKVAILADVWLAYLARLLFKEGFLKSDNLAALVDLPSAAIDKIHLVLSTHRTQVITALDELDAWLEREKRWVFINSDELDTLGGIDWDVMSLRIRSLLTFWAEYARLWRRLQPKLFLRSDLFTNSQVFSADFAKLATSRIELNWSNHHLYAMLIKRMANLSDEWLTYCRSAGINFEQDEKLGWMPRLAGLESAQPMIEQMVGEFMGSGNKKGRTFTWILKHLSDAKGQITPRALIGLWGYAAFQELESPKSNPKHLLTPSGLRRALDFVSDDYIRTLKSREMPWLEELGHHLSQREVPLTHNDWEEIFSPDRW